MTQSINLRKAKLETAVNLKRHINDTHTTEDTELYPTLSESKRIYGLV